MYLIIIVFGLLSKRKRSKISSYYIYFNLLLSNIKFADKYPSAWCWSSAVAAPIIYLLLKNNLNVKNILKNIN